MAFSAFEVRIIRDLRLFLNVREKHEIGLRGLRDSCHISAGTIKKYNLSLGSTRVRSQPQGEPKSLELLNPNSSGPSIWMKYEWDMNEIWMRYEWWYEWCMNDIWMIYEWYMNEIWMIYEWYMNDIWMRYEWYMNDIWMIYEWYMNDIWMIYEWDMNDIWMIYERDMNDI